jgi:hypothetical protein
MLSAVKRGRSLTFGRAARAVARTRPTDVSAALPARSPDLAREIVGLCKQWMAPARSSAAHRPIGVARIGRRAARSAALRALRRAVKQWRQDGRMRVCPRSIIALDAGPAASADPR